MTDVSGVEVGQRVKFTGFTSDPDEMADNGELLKKNQTYELVAINDDVAEDEDIIFVLQVANPNYDDSKRKSKNNQEFLTVECFDDEFVPAKAQKAKAKAPAAKAKAKTTAKKPAAKSKAKPKAKAKAAPKAKAKPKATAKSKLKDKTEEEAPETVNGLVVLANEDAEVLALIESADDICELAHDKVEEADAIDYQLGGILYHVRISGAYKDLHEDYAGNKGFDAYCENELGIKYRKAMYLIEIYTAFCQFGISGQVVAEHGWTKCMEIARVMTEDNADELVELAAESSVTELKDAISETYAKKGSDTREKVKRIGFKFRLPEESGNTIQAYLEQAGQELGVDDVSQVFEQIVTEWATEHLNLKKQRPKKQTRKAA